MNLSIASEYTHIEKIVLKKIGDYSRLQYAE